MRDISKKLTIINTGERKDNTSGTSSAQAASYGGGGGGVTIGGGLYLPKAIWDNVFEIKTAESGEEYLFGKLPIALQYGLTMYGDATTLNIPSIYNGLPIDGTTIYWDNGVLKAKGGESGGGVADSVAWANITGKPTFASVATSGKYDDLIGKPTLLSSFTDDIVSGKYLPLSGGTLTGENNILTLSGATNSYIYYNIGSTKKASTGYYNNLAFIANETTYARLGIADDGTPQYHTDNKATKVYTIWHSGNFTPSNYLPLSGGTLTNDSTILTLKRNDIEGGAWINFYNNSGKLGAIGIGGSKSPVQNDIYYHNAVIAQDLKVWHEGNDGSGSGLDADLLDGIDSSLMFYARNGRITADNVNTRLENGVYYTSGYSPISGAYTYGTFLNFRSGVVGTNARQTQFYIPDGAQWEQSNRGARLYIRDLFNASDNIWTEWHEIITDSRIGYYNSGSATKLQTARTIWGQSFDGTGNVSGNLIGSNFGIYDVSGNPYIKFSSSGVSTLMQMLTTGALSLGSSYTHFVITQEGNVGIGTTSPSGRLQINHSAYDNGLILRRTADTAGSSIRFYSNDTQLGFIGINGSKRIEIGVNSGDLRATIDASANMLVYGGITMYSDQRKKTILGNVELSIKEIANAPLIEHYYNSDERKTTHVGSIAQYWYGLNDWFCKEDSEGYLTMEIQNAALASAISIARELDRYETKTDKTIKQLRKRICQLEEELERLKSA